MPADIPQIHLVNTLAFEGAAEATIINKLRRVCPIFVSLVAEVDEKVVGHILFTPAWLENSHIRVEGMALAPLAVLPEFQNRGIGGKLVQAGLHEIQKSNAPFVIVLGHPNYYPRFGFERASKYHISCEYESVPDEAFMIYIFDRQALPTKNSIAHYSPEWAEAV
jgi:putative acetyltransferase